MFEQRSHEQLARLLELEDTRKQLLLLFAEVANGFVGEEAQEGRCGSRGLGRGRGLPEATGLDQSMMVVVRERNECWATLHLLLLPVHDHHRASRVLGALLADRPGQASVGARAEHEQLGAARFADETLCRRAVDDAAVDLDIVELSSHLASRGLEQFLGRTTDSGSVAPLERTVRTERTDGVDGAQARLTDVRFLKCEPQCRLRPS